MRKLVLIPLLLSAGACGGDGTGPDNAALSAAEAAELNRAVFGMAAALAGGGSMGVSLNRVPMPAGNTFTVPVQETVPCTPSGSMALAGTVTVKMGEAAGAASIEANVTATPAACAHKLESGKVVTMTGDPNIQVTMTAAGGLSSLTSLRVTEKGAFTWTRGKASGRCAVDVTAQLNAAGTAVAVSGTFCGFPVSETVPLG